MNRVVVQLLDGKSLRPENDEVEDDRERDAPPSNPLQRPGSFDTFEHRTLGYRPPGSRRHLCHPGRIDIVTQQFQTAQLLPPDVRLRLSGELICYGRSVIAIEWPLIASDIHPPFNPWGAALLRTLQTIEPRTASEQSAYDLWLSQTSRREEERRHRLHGGEGLVPLPVWLVLIFCAALILLYLLFFADSGEPAVMQSLMAGSITGVLVSTLLLLAVLGRPYQRDLGGLEPVAMHHTLEIIDHTRSTLGIDDPPPCDEAGRPS